MVSGSSPHDDYKESEVLNEWTTVSLCLSKPDEAEQATNTLTPEMFTEPNARNVFSALSALAGDGLPTDINHLIETLESRKHLNQATADRLHIAAAELPCATPISYYAGKVQQQHQKRLARLLLERATDNLRKGGTLDPTIDTVVEGLTTLTSGRPRQDTRTITPDSGFVAFPVESLPPILRSFTTQTAHAIGCDTSFVALPLLAACAAAIGNSRRLRIKQGWFVPPIIWAAIVGESGTQKSPPFRAVMKPLKQRQQEQVQAYQAELMQYKADLTDFKRELRQHEKTGAGIRPTDPPLPSCQRCIVSDTTIEGLVSILADNWRGVLLQRDELVGWIGGFDKYTKSGTASTDASHWLSIFNADGIIVDRKTGDTKTVFVPDASVSVVGGIQPGILNRVLNEEHRENGLAARLLMTYPPRRPKQWRDDEVPSTLEAQYRELLHELFEFKPNDDSDGKSRSAVVGLTDDARSLFVSFYNNTGEEQAGLTGDLAAAWSKLEEYAARLALVFHCVRQASGEAVNPWVCDADSMCAGIVLTEWFKQETSRIYTMLSESTRERERRQLAEWILQRGGSARARDLVSGRRDVSMAQDADRLLQELVTADYGRWHSIPSGAAGGRPTREFVLHESDSLRF